MLGATHAFTHCHIPEDYDPHQHNSKNLKPCKLNLFLQFINNTVLSNIKYKFSSQKSSESMISYSRGAQTLGAWLPRQLNFVWWCNIFNTVCSFPPLTYKNVYQFTCTEQRCQKTVRSTSHTKTVGSQYGRCIMTPFRHLEFRVGS